MKKILIVTTFLATLTLAADTAPKAVGTTPPRTVDKSFELRLDSLRTADSALIAAKRQEIAEAFQEQRAKDSALFANKLPDTLRTKIENRLKEFEAKKTEFDSIKIFDSTKVTEYKAKADSLRKNWEAKRDSQITKIKDTAVRAKVQARIAEIEKHRAEVKARIDARKAEFEAKIAELKAKIEKMKADKAAAPTTK